MLTLALEGEAMTEILKLLGSRAPTRPEMFPPVLPASSAIVKQLPERCPQVVEALFREPRLGPNSA